MSAETYRFKKGQTMHLDEIYDIQGLAGGDWWTSEDPADKDGDGGESITITRDITIKITVTP